MIMDVRTIYVDVDDEGEIFLGKVFGKLHSDVVSLFRRDRSRHKRLSDVVGNYIVRIPPPTSPGVNKNPASAIGTLHPEAVMSLPWPVLAGASTYFQNIADAAPILRPMPVCRDMIQVAAQSGPPFLAHSRTAPALFERQGYLCLMVYP